MSCGVRAGCRSAGSEWSGVFGLAPFLKKERASQVFKKMRGYFGVNLDLEMRTLVLLMSGGERAQKKPSDHT